MTPLEILGKYWGHTAFRPSQEAIIQAVLKQQDTLAVLPTGGGKSVCFQVPALGMNGCCLVISPLIALMQDQVQRLNEMGIPSGAILSGMDNDEINSLLEDCENGDIKFLYVSPERLESKRFLEHLDNIPLCLLAVDEAHCISQWGYDFRPSYLKISKIRKAFPKVPIIALTASATPTVKKDIATKLELRQPIEFSTSFTRKNLTYTCESTPYKYNRLLELVKNGDGSGIIYCRSRKKTQDIHQLLSQNGIASNHYHAGLAQAVRDERQQQWIRGENRIMVCTNAFGMGIDKPDVRIVIHADVPDCLENYYQEAGRAGRDGKPSKAVLLYTAEELEALRLLPEMRFPSMDTLRKAYHALANFLQVPSGAGAGQLRDFDFGSFISRFNWETKAAFHCLQALEQEGLILQLEKSYLPSTLQVTAGKELLFAFENDFPSFDQLMKTILRTYAGILDHPVRINEDYLARRSRMEMPMLKKALLELQQHGIIRYAPKKDKPQLCFLTDRVPANELQIDHKSYLARKRGYADRIEKMIEYATTGQCRSVVIGRYFGDGDIAACGQCDNCQKESNAFNARDSQTHVLESIIKLLTDWKTVKELQQKTAIPEKEILVALKKLHEEGKIQSDGFGRIGLK